MNGYKSEYTSQETYMDKGLNQRAEHEEVDFDELSREMKSIENITNGVEISESLGNLIDLTSNPDFTFYKPLPSQIITEIISQLQEPESSNKNIQIQCLEFIGNIWNIPLLYDECLLELVVSKCFNESLEIALFAIRSISNLIASTTKEGDEHFGVDEFKLDILLFPQDPSRENIDLDNFHKLLSYFESGSDELIISVLQLILNVTRVYKYPICKMLIDNENFTELINKEVTQNLSLLIVCNLAKDKNCFKKIFDEAFTSQFISFAINNKDPDVIFNIYSALSLFPVNGLIKKLENEDLWESIKTNLTELSQFDMTELLNLIDQIIIFYPMFLDKYDFWPCIFEKSDDFSLRNKEGFANVLTEYFDRTSNYAVQDIEQPPLCFAVNGGFEFLCEILEIVTNPLLFYNISFCLIRLAVSNPEIFGNIIHDLHLISNLNMIKMDMMKDMNEEDKKDRELITVYITDFIKSVSPFTLK